MSSSGPNTPEGKAAVAKNSLRHGLRSPTLVLPEVESQEEFDAFRARMFETLGPRGHLEEELASMAVEARWRLSRANRAETEAVLADRARRESDNRIFGRLSALAEQLYTAGGHPGFSTPAPTGEKRPIPVSSLPSEERLNPILRYQQQQSRLFYQALHALQAMQDRRNGRPAPLVRLQWH